MPGFEELLLSGAILLCVAGLSWSGRSTPPELTGVVLFVCLLLLRPGLLGELVGPVGALLLLAVLMLVLRQQMGKVGRPPGQQALALTACAILPRLLDAGISSAVLSGLLVTPLVGAAGWVAGKDHRLLDGFIGATALLSLQQSVALTATELLSLDHWPYEATVGGRAGWTYSISRLGSVTVGSGGVLRIFDARLTGPFGEPGVFAAFVAIVGTIDLAARQEWRWRIQIPIVGAIVLTQSIAGMGAYAAGVGVFLVVAARHSRERSFRFHHYLLIIAALVGCLWASTKKDGVLAAKSAANATSVAERLSGVSPTQLIAQWTAHPLGDRVNSSINLVQSSVAYGPLILVFGLWLYLATLKGKYSWRAAPIVAAILLTVVFSQPPFLYSWIFFSLAATGIAVSTAKSTQLRYETNVDAPLPKIDHRPLF